MKGVGSVPLSPAKGSLFPKFERITLMDIEDTFSGMADSLEHLAGVVSELREHSYQANRRWARLKSNTPRTVHDMRVKGNPFSL